MEKQIVIPRIISHRGKDNPPSFPEEDYSGLENTYSQLTERLKDYGIETDVWLSSDGHLVCIHGKYGAEEGRLERTTNGKGFIGNFSLSELEKLDAGDSHGIPNLERILQYASMNYPDSFIAIELKGYGTGASAAKLLQEYTISNSNLALFSFKYKELKEAKEVYPNIHTIKFYVELELEKILEGDAIGKAIKDKDIGIAPIWRILMKNPEEMIINQEYIKRAKGEGLKIITWPVDNPELFGRLIDSNVDGIMTNKPNMMKERFGNI